LAIIDTDSRIINIAEINTNVSRITTAKNYGAMNTLLMIAEFDEKKDETEFKRM